MSGITLTGTLTLGDSSCGCGGIAADTTYVLGFGACAKTATVSLGTGSTKRAVNSPGSFVPLEGPGTTIRRCDFLFLNADSTIDLRLTLDDGSGGDVVSTIKHKGLLMKEFDPSYYLKLVEVKGVAQIAYLATGAS